MFDARQPAAGDSCPSCGTALERVAGYSSWCDRCDWNLDPLNREAPKLTVRDRFLARIGEAASSRLHRQFLDANELRPRFTLSKAGAYLLSALVLVASLLFAVAGLLLIATGRVFGVVAGLVLIGFAWVARPRVSKVEVDLDQPELVPTLTAVANRIAGAVGTKPADGVVITDDFNAAVFTNGWRRRRVLLVGLPLFAVLGAQERVALLAHEFGHFANGDPRRGTIVSYALESLISWHSIFLPQSLTAGDEENGIPGILMLPFNLLMFIVAWIPGTLALLLIGLMGRESQRGEYLADAKAAEIAGMQALVTAWDKLQLGSVYQLVASSTSDEHWLNNSLWDELRQRVRDLPERERERNRRLERALAPRLGSTHPPTHLRIEAVLSRGELNPTLQLTAEENNAIDADLKRVLPRVQRLALDRHVESLETGATLAEVLETY